MIKTKAGCTIEDQDGVNNVDFEVNFDQNRRDLIKITLGNKISLIKKDDLWNFVFTIVKTDQQQQMIPVRKEEMEQYVKQHTVELQRDMKKGEIMAVNCKVNVRQEVADTVRRELEEKKLSTVSPYMEKKV